MNLKKYFLLDNYLSKYRTIKKKINIWDLSKLKNPHLEFNFCWKIKYSKFNSRKISATNNYSIFGKTIDLENKINWHKDSFSNFTYPVKRFDKINASQWFDSGVELVFPWEKSRFYFGVSLAKKYLVSKNKKYYFFFKSMVEDWIVENPFLYGVNWLSTMDISIRAVNWIIALNLFQEIFDSDKKFKKKITRSLYYHAKYIVKFPLIETGGLTTNHTTSAYTGLLFLSLTLKEHSEAPKWLQIAKDGLEKCIQQQVYKDGVDFEGSIPYHRLVLELFAYSSIIASANAVMFSKAYYRKLFKMLEFSAAYMDSRGNAPQLGDNDSGRLLVFNDDNNNPYENEHNHTYLLDLGESIFDYKFTSQCRERDGFIKFFLPKIEKINLAKIDIKKSDINKCMSFTEGGVYFLKNKIFNLCVSFFPSGQNGKGGHNHLDTGSFTLSMDGEQIIVDPGSYCYSRDRKKRDEFRSYCYHNNIYNSNDFYVDLSSNGYWSLKNPYSFTIMRYEEFLLESKVCFKADDKIRFRTFELSKNKLSVSNKLKGFFYSKINLHPSIEIDLIENQITLQNKYKININSSGTEVSVESYYYSPYYGSKVRAKCLIFKGKDLINFDIIKNIL